MTTFIDCNAAVGYPVGISGWRAYAPDDVKRLALNAGICHMFAYHNSVLDLHPLDGNAEMDIIANINPFFSSVWAVLPNHTGEFYNPDVLAEELAKHKIEMVRLFPKYNSMSFSLSDWCCGELLSTLEDRGTVVLIDQEQVDWEEINRMCANHPKLKVVITNMYYRHARYVIALMKKHHNLFIESSGMKSFGLLQTFCEQIGAERIVFGSNLGTFSAGSAVSLVNYAMITQSEKEQIACHTLESLLERQVI